MFVHDSIQSHPIWNLVFILFAITSCEFISEQVFLSPYQKHMKEKIFVNFFLLAGLRFIT